MKRSRSVAAVVLVGIGLLAGAEASPGKDGNSRPDLGRCGKNVEGLGLRCGTLDVPFERADPSLGTIAISFAVRERDRASKPSRGAIFAVEGGPGYGSIGSARAYIDLFGGLLRRRELVLVDMRGTGHSEAIDCPALQRGAGPEGAPTVRCARRLGPRFGSYRTSAAADDLDAVRQALGLETIDLYGDSYGTYLSQSYAFRHGDTLDALVLDSAYPVLGEKSGWYPSLIPTGIRSMEIACRRSPGCEGDARARLRRFVALLRAEGQSVEPLLDAIGNGGYSPPGSYLRINAAIGAYLGGNERPYQRLTKPSRGGFGSASYYSVGDEVAVSCNDYPMIWSKESGEQARRRELRRAIEAYRPGRFRPFTPREIALDRDWSYLECLDWPHPSPLYEPPAAPGAEAPDVSVLVLAGELDDVTTPSEGRMTAALFPDASFEVIRNAGHVPSLYGDRYPAAARVREFLRRASG